MCKFDLTASKYPGQPLRASIYDLGLSHRRVLVIYYEGNARGGSRTHFVTRMDRGGYNYAGRPYSWVSYTESLTAFHV